MLEVFNRLNVKVSCLGNHDTDMGLAKMQELVHKTNSKWLMANLYLDDGTIVGNLDRSTVIEYNGTKIGLFGLCEWEWLGILDPNTVTEQLTYKDFVETAKEMS